MIIKRPRIKKQKTFEERLTQEAAQFKELAEQTPPGMQRELYLRRAEQAEAAWHMSEWLRPPGSKSPA